MEREPSKRLEELVREIETLREQNSHLGAAILRINESLDLATVLREVVEAACALTAARFGVIATVDEAGEVQDFVSAGLTQDEHRKMAQWPDGPCLFGHLRDLPSPLRTADMKVYVRDLGFRTDTLPSRTLIGVPLSRGRERVGNFFVAGKEDGGEFSAEDEKVMILFASQAAAAIANARTYRDEQRGVRRP